MERPSISASSVVEIGVALGGESGISLSTFGEMTSLEEVVGRVRVGKCVCVVIVRYHLQCMQDRVKLIKIVYKTGCCATQIAKAIEQDFIEDIRTSPSSFQEDTLS